MATTKRRVPPQDAMFLWGETAETMMHVASLMPFTPPADAGPTYLRDMLADLRQMPVKTPWNLKLTHPHMLLHPRQGWVEDDDFDIDYHVRRSALASPGDERELGVLVSRLHSHQLDFTRPPWEMHIIEGLEGGRFALYTKVHHALVDGYTAVKLLGRSLSPDPTSTETVFFFSAKAPSRPRPPAATKSLLEQVTAPVAGVTKGVGAVAGMSADMAKAVFRLEAGKYKDSTVVNSLSAPDSILNGRTGRNRRFATQQYEMERLRTLARRSGGTLNDVVMAICGGGLRHFLAEQGELPTKPLIAFMPVNIRNDGDEGGGNMVGASLATMGTDIDDPIERIEAVIASTQQAKASLKGMGQLSALAWSGYMLAPQATQVLTSMAGVRNPLPRAFNVCLSNVPGPRQTLYLNRSRLEAVYPMSIPIHGMALNITMESYADTLNFGFIGCRDAVPSLQKLAVYTGHALAELEAAYDARDEAAARKAAAPARKRTASKSGASAKTRSALAPAKTTPVKRSTKKTAKKAVKKTVRKTAAKPATKAAPAQKATQKTTKRTVKKAPARKRSAAS